MQVLINDPIAVDFSKITKVLSEFQPQWDARKGAQELYEVYKQHDLKLDDFEGSKYKRIDHIKLLLSEGKLDSSLRWAK